MTSTIKPSINTVQVHREMFTMPANKKDDTFALTIPSGWTFTAILGCSSSGWAGLVYPTSMSSAEVHIVMEEAVGNARDFYIHYLIRK